LPTGEAPSQKNGTAVSFIREGRTKYGIEGDMSKPDGMASIHGGGTFLKNPKSWFWGKRRDKIPITF